MMYRLGPDWHYGDQDGGRGNKGVVDNVDHILHQVWVVWTSMSRCNYRWGTAKDIQIVCAVAAGPPQSGRSEPSMALPTIRHIIVLYTHKHALLQLDVAAT